MSEKRQEARLQIPLDRTSDVPLFLQIKRHVERLIAAGVLPAGSKLPATRGLAQPLSEPHDGGDRVREARGRRLLPPAHLPDGLDAAALLPRAVERGVAYDPGAFFFIGGESGSTLRLSFAALSAPRIEEGVRRLAAVVRKAQRRPTPAVVGRRPAVPLV